MADYETILDELIEKQNLESASAAQFYPVHTTSGKFGLKKEVYEVNSAKLEKLFHKPKGTYVILNFAEIMFATNEELEYLVKQISLALKPFLQPMKPSQNVLIAGLGNRSVHADSLGIAVLKHIMVNGEHAGFVKSKKAPNIFCFSPSVSALTGLSSSDIVNGIVKQKNIHKLIVVDTLCASNFKRLGCSFQINNGGIVPGGGVGNAQKPINKKHLNLEVVSLGVPLVVYAQSLVANALYDVLGKKSLQTSEAKQMEQMLTNYNFENLVVAPKNIEDLVSLCGKVIGYAINMALTGLSVMEQNQWFYPL